MVPAERVRASSVVLPGVLAALAMAYAVDLANTVAKDANPLLVTATLLHLHLKSPQDLEVSLQMVLAAAQTSSSVVEAPLEIVVRNKAGAATQPPTAVTTVFLTLEHAVLPVT